MSVGEKILAARKAKGWTLRRLSSECGLSVSYLCDLENGRKTNLTMATAEKLATAVGGSIGDFGTHAVPSFGRLEATLRLELAIEQLANALRLVPSLNAEPHRLLKHKHAIEAIYDALATDEPTP